MSEWKEYKLGELVKTNKKSINSDYPFEEIEYLDTGSITRGKIESFQKYKLSEAPSRAKRLVVQDDIIYSTVRPIQRHYGFIDNPLSNLVVSTGFATITCKKDKLNPKFLYYILSNDDTVEYLDVIAEASTSAYPSLRPSDIENLDITIPELPEQKSIASILSSLDDKIELLHRQNATLEKMTETLFRQMMSEHDFKRLPDGQDDATKKSCLSNYPDNHVQDNVEEAKEEWEDIKITDLFEVKDGTHDSPKQKEFGKKLITSKHLSKHSIDFESAYFISEEDFEQINKRSKVDSGDILFSMIGTIGIIYLEQSNEIDYAIKNIGLFKTSQNPLWKYFTVLWLKSDFGNEFIFENRSGSTQEYISLGSLRSIVFSIPPIKTVKEFNKEIEPLFQKIKSNQTQIRTLTTLRDTLLPKLMSGEVRVEMS